MNRGPIIFSLLYKSLYSIRRLLKSCEPVHISIKRYVAIYIIKLLKILVYIHIQLIKSAIVGRQQSMLSMTH